MRGSVIHVLLALVLTDIVGAHQRYVKRLAEEMLGQRAREDFDQVEPAVPTPSTKKTSPRSENSRFAPREPKYCPPFKLVSDNLVAVPVEEQLD